MTHVHKYPEALMLRTKGFSVKEIAKQLEVSVGAVSYWTRGVKLNRKAAKKIEQRRKIAYLALRKNVEERNKARKTQFIQLVDISREYVKINKNTHFMAGLCLYWGEGFKKHSVVGLTSMDPDILRLFIKWLHIHFNVGVRSLRIRVSINMTARNREKKILRYWQNELGADLKNFTKSHIFKAKRKKVYPNPDLYKGVVRITVLKSSQLLRKIEACIQALALNSESWKGK